MQSVLDELSSTPPEAFVGMALIAEKAGHAVSRLSAKLARHEAETVRQSNEIEELKQQRSRKKIPIEKNKKFADVATVQKAKSKQSASEEKIGLFEGISQCRILSTTSQQAI